MNAVLLYSLFLVAWLLALYRSLSHSEIDLHLEGSGSLHGLQVLFWLGIGMALVGAALTLLTDVPAWLILMAAGVVIESAVALWIFCLHLSWDEKVMMWGSRPDCTEAIHALEPFASARVDRVLYLGLGAAGIVVGALQGEWTYAAALCGLALVTRFAFSHCRRMRYAAVTDAELWVRYGTPPIYLHKLHVDDIAGASCHARDDRIGMTIQPEAGKPFTLQLPSQSRVARIILSHLPMKAQADRKS